jgi:hypothetical protein
MHYAERVAQSARLRVAENLVRLGLGRTLLLVPGPDTHTVARIKTTSDQIALAPLGKLPASELPKIGRVGAPDPQLGERWANVMPFYGNWFDDIGETDIDYQLRRNIAALSSDRLLDQVARDNRYALVADFAAVFRTIMTVKKRVPLVLVNDTHLAIDSFPVVLPAIEDPGLHARFQGILHVMLKAAAHNSDDSSRRPDGVDGIEVEEMDG